MNSLSIRCKGRSGSFLVHVLIISAFWMICSASLYAQDNLPYMVDFNNGIPGSWTQPVDTILPWTFSDTLGVDRSGAIVADRSDNSDMISAWIETPWFDLNTVQHPVMRFSFALIQNNFMPPSLSLYYDDGTGWRRLRTWGAGSNFVVEDEEEVVTTSSNFGIPLRRENIHWVDMEHDLNGLGNFSLVRFAFQAHIINGGWALLDNVEIVPSESSGLEEQREGESHHAISIVPNPALSSVRVRSLAGSIRQIELVDPLGHVLLHEKIEGKTDEHLLRVEELPVGLYRVRVTGDDGEMVNAPLVKY